MRNQHRLSEVLTRDTADLIFDRQFIRQLVSARTWTHLELLTDSCFLEVLQNHHPAVDRTLRELLAVEDSPLRTSALLGEGGDETLHCSNEQQLLINRTFRDSQWYHKCRAGYPVLIAACEKIDSGILDASYNRADARYGTGQGISTRSNCLLFLAEKTIVHGLKASLESGESSIENTHRDACDLGELFRMVYAHSRYQPETWDEPFGYGDYPTPFGFLLAEILRDCDFICDEAWRSSDHGSKPPVEILKLVVRMWTFCIMRLSKDEGHVSSGFRANSAKVYLNMILMQRHGEVNASGEKDNRTAWTAIFMESLKEAVGMHHQEGKEYLRDVIGGLDLAHLHVSENLSWLRSELGISEE